MQMDLNQRQSKLTSVKIILLQEKVYLKHILSMLMVHIHLYAVILFPQGHYSD